MTPTKTQIDKSSWIWMPHPGHLCVSRDCRFHLNTRIGGYIISTVGEWWPDYRSRLIHAKVYDPDWLAENQSLKGGEFDVAYFKRFGYEEIGVGRTYETMVFKAQKSNTACCPYEMKSSAEIDFAGYNDADGARIGHMKICEKWAKKSRSPKPL